MRYGHAAHAHTARSQVTVSCPIQVSNLLSFEERAHPKKTASTVEMLNLKSSVKCEPVDEDGNLFKIGSEFYDPRQKATSTPLKSHSQSMMSLSSGQASFRDLCSVDKERLSALIQQVAE